MSQIKAVIFDHDGVMVDNQSAQKIAWEQLFKERGMNVSAEQLKMKIRGRPTLDGLRNFFSGQLSEEEIVELAARKEHLYKEIFEKNFTFVSGLIPFLEDLKKAGIELAIATSSSTKMLDFSLSHGDVKKYFDVIVSSNEIAKNKPDPEIYLVTAKKLGSSPENTIVFEDSIAGIESANRAGMKVILVQTSHNADEIIKMGLKIDMSINNFSEITAQSVLSL